MANDTKNPMLATRIFIIRLQPFSLECMSSGSCRGRENGEWKGGGEKREREREREGGKIRGSSREDQD